MADPNSRSDPPAPAREMADVRALLQRAQSGDAEARQQLVVRNQRLVRSIVSRFTAPDREAEDLFQLGCIGLLKAIDRFDLTQPVQFSTYAVPLILGEIRRHLRDDGPIRISRSLKGLGYRILRAQEQLAKDLQREPTLAEVSGNLGVSVEEVVAALEGVRAPASIHEPVFAGDGDPVYLGDQLADQSQTETSWLNQVALKQALGLLPERERQILLLRYFRDKTQVEVARLLGLSQVQISRLERRALAQVRQHLSTA